MLYSDKTSRMKVLIITYYWPPSGGSGVQRWLKLSKYLPKYGIHPVIYTPHKPFFEQLDPTLEAEVSKDIEVWRKRIWEPYRIFSFFSKKSEKDWKRQGFSPRKNMSWIMRCGVWLRANLFIPDPKIGWVLPSVAQLKRRLKTESISCVITTGPPHSLHLIGYLLKKQIDITWIADFRDPWTNWEILMDLKPSALALRIHRHLEKRVLKNCDLLLTVSRHWAQSFQQAGARRTYVLRNGYDLSDIPKESQKIDTNTFHLVHFGNLSWQRSKHLWYVLQSMCEQSEAFRQTLRISLGGRTEALLRAKITQLSMLSKQVQFVGSVTHKEVFRYYQGASVLLIFSTIAPGTYGQISGKLYEYFAVRRPILLFGEPQGEAAQLIHQQQAGLAVNFHDQESIQHALKALHQGQTFNYQDATQFLRARQACELAKELACLSRTPIS